MIAFDQRNIVALGGATAAALAGIYVLWGPSEKKRPKRKDLVPGLINLGNTCFLNAVLQALAPCPSVVQWLSNFMDTQLHHRDCTHFLAYTLIKVIKVLNNQSVERPAEHSPVGVLAALQARRWVITADEQDAHELFHVLTETLDEEAARYPAVASLLDLTAVQEGPTGSYKQCLEANSRTGGQMPTLPGRDADHPFRGLLASQLQCKQCGYKYPVKYDTFDSLSLSIPTSHVGPLSLERLLKHYIMSETVQNVECDGCARQRRLLTNQDCTNKPRTTFIKKLTIGKLPQCLCIHIQRTVWLDNGMPMKRHEHISFPETLHMDEYVYHRHRKPAAPHISLDLEGGATGLVGGRRHLNGFNKVNTQKFQVTSPTVQAPYSRSLNLLKALNYHSRATMGGFYVHRDPRTSWGGHSAGPNPADPHVQRLAQAYSSEVSMYTPSCHAYKLTSAVVHLGDVFSGHFVTYRRTPSLNGQRFPDRWLYTSDSLVKKASSAEVLRADAYMLFYEKI